MGVVAERSRKAGIQATPAFGKNLIFGMNFASLQKLGRNKPSLNAKPGWGIDDAQDCAFEKAKCAKAGAVNESRNAGD